MSSPLIDAIKSRALGAGFIDRMAAERVEERYLVAVRKLRDVLAQIQSGELMKDEVEDMIHDALKGTEDLK